MSLFADDTDSFLKDAVGIAKLLNELKLFGAVSGWYLALSDLDFPGTEESG